MCFNPRTRMGVRYGEKKQEINGQVVSIRALTWSAIQSGFGQRDTKPRFNPRTYTRCDPKTETQSCTCKRFNPRTYTRCDSQQGVS